MNKQPFKWKEVSFPVFQQVLSSGQTYFVPPELRPEWAQNLNTVSGAWLYYYGGRPRASTRSLSTSAVNAHVDVERFDPTDTGLLKYDRYFYIKMDDGCVFQAGPWKDVDYGHHLRRRPDWAEQYSSESATL